MIYTEALVNEALAAGLVALIRERMAAYRAELEAGISLKNVRRDVDVDAQAAGIFAFVRGSLILSQLDLDFPLDAAFETYCAGLTAQLAPQPSE
jgi:hypothetical protein